MNAREKQEENIETTEPQIQITTNSYTIQDGDTFTKAAEQLEIPYSEALAIVEAATDTFDFTRVRIGKTLSIVFEDGVRKRLEYEPDNERVIVVDLQNNYATTEKPIEYNVELTTAQVTIQESMFLSGVNAGVPETVILDMAEIFAWEIDFATQTQTGDSFQVLYEKRTRNGQESTPGKVLAATFTNRGSVSSAFRFETEEKAGYYDAAGNSLVRPFLKAPLSYSRITSGFSYSRFHPVLGTNTMHRAIDYAAPLGTPIMAVGDGTITYLGYNGGYGNYIDIRHNATFETQYAHLSSYAQGLRAGSRVTQGQVIGYVGSTGYSTGPHLHYQVEVNGELVNPLEVEFPSGDAIAEEYKPAFDQKRSELEQLLQN